MALPSPSTSAVVTGFNLLLTAGLSIVLTEGGRDFLLGILTRANSSCSKKQQARKWTHHNVTDHNFISGHMLPLLSWSSLFWRVWSNREHNIIVRKSGQTDLSVHFCISQEKDAVFLGHDLWNVMACYLQASECFELGKKNFPNSDQDKCHKEASVLSWCFTASPRGHSKKKKGRQSLYQMNACLPRMKALVKRL